ncbi:MAG: hypothetical protein JSS98_10275 [Bacteroidetes bacterium]|nr:hypothetical protein [Bacteroidota bacterium]
MRTSISTLLFTFCFIFCNAQQKDYKPLLDTFFLHAENSFKNIAEEPNDSSAFSPCKLKADVGELKIGRYPYTTTLNWIIPLAQSKKIQTDVQEYIRTNVLGKPAYQIVSNGTVEEGYQTTNVYVLKENEKPLVFFKTIYYKTEKEPEKNNFTIITYEK